MTTRTTWKAAGVAAAVAMAAVLMSAQASSADPPKPATASDTGTIVTDSFSESTSSFNAPQVAGLDGKQFLANITAQCVFDQSPDNTASNTVIVSLQIAPEGQFIRLEESSTDHRVTIVTGPVTAFDPPSDVAATYLVFCIPGTGNEFNKAMAQAWLQVLP